ncbi:MAG: hypothetical protein WED33_07960 [Bacteroidia bacterium]
MRHALFILLVVFSFINTSVAQPQQLNFPVEFEVSQPVNFPALHSFCWAQKDGKWLIMSGRNNGLHGFQPPSAFPTTNQNTLIFVYDPGTGSISSASVDGLPTLIADQVSSSNLEFHQFNNKLVLVGGYGFSQTDQVYKTFPSLLYIDVPGLMSAVEAGEPMGEYFLRVQDERMAVCGSYLGHIDDTYYLVFGHRFDGRYNPFNGGSYTQTYTDEIRYFNLAENGNSVEIQNYDAWWDQDHFHRRDYNLVPQISPEGSLYFTAFTGVFLRDINMPHKTSVHFNQNGYEVDSNFTQLLNQYHTAHLPMYSSNENSMRTLFFGGIGENYVGANNQIIQDSLVPFTKTVSMVYSDASGRIEGWLPGQLDEYAGASASFIPDLSAPYDQNLILNLDELPLGRVHVGSIVGGIISDSKNTFMQSSGTTIASNKIIEVYIDAEVLKAQSQNAAGKVLINQTDEGILVKLSNSSNEKVSIDFLDASGKVVYDFRINVPAEGKLFTYDSLRSLKGISVCRLSNQGFIHTKKLLFPQ